MYCDSSSIGINFTVIFHHLQKRESGKSLQEKSSELTQRGKFIKASLREFQSLLYYLLASA
jgi:hypothetical protein